MKASIIPALCDGRCLGLRFGKVASIKPALWKAGDLTNGLIIAGVLVKRSNKIAFSMPTIMYWQYVGHEL